ncbi:hypothetical protein LCGC14_2952450, partial [marine sediment metagenome]
MYSEIGCSFFMTVTLPPCTAPGPVFAVVSDGDGDFSCGLVWPAPLKPGIYDVVIDCGDIPGRYDPN